MPLKFVSQCLKMVKMGLHVPGEIIRVGPDCHFPPEIILLPSGREEGYVIATSEV